MTKPLYTVEPRCGQTNIVCRGVKVGMFYSAELAEKVAALLNADPPKAPPSEENEP
jgi:hypothetical protein